MYPLSFTEICQIRLRFDSILYSSMDLLNSIFNSNIWDFHLVFFVLPRREKTQIREQMHVTKFYVFNAIQFRASTGPEHGFPFVLFCFHYREYVCSVYNGRETCNGCNACNDCIICNVCLVCNVCMVYMICRLATSTMLTTSTRFERLANGSQCLQWLCGLQCLHGLQCCSV